MRTGDGQHVACATRLDSGGSSAAAALLPLLLTEPGPGALHRNWFLQIKPFVFLHGGRQTGRGSEPVATPAAWTQGATSGAHARQHCGATHVAAHWPPSDTQCDAINLTGTTPLEI
jgi:hypothetical protein